MMWYPGKAAFRAGYAVGAAWEDANIGLYSIALGSGSVASGQGSAALGAGIAGGQGSSAIGPNAHANGDNSVALGTAVGAGGAYAIAIGSFSDANADRAVAIGSGVVASGSYSTVMGRYASTNGHSGSFVYGDNSTQTTVNALGAQQFVVRAVGGTIIYSSSAGAQNTWTGVRLNAGSGSWSALSDVRRKERFQTVSGEEVLTRLRGLPLATWSYRTQDPSVRHLGPTAQDFRAAFGLGEDSVTISGVDADGVALAAAQALEARTARLSQENAALRSSLEALSRENQALREEQQAIMRRLDMLASRIPGGR